MSEKVPRISDAEMEVMRIVWDAGEPITSNEILDRLPSEKDWKITTVLTLASRLMEKQVLTSVKKGRTHYYEPLMSEQDYRGAETSDFLKRIHGGSLTSFFAALNDSGEISGKDVEELKKWFAERWRP